MSTRYFFIISVVLFSSPKAQAQANSNRKYLTGNWAGYRDSLEEKGLFINPRLTVFNQNFVGGTGSKNSEFNGKAQIGIKFNGAVMGLSRWTLITKTEYNFGNVKNASGNVLVPKNTAIAFPGNTPGKRFDVSSFFLVYTWKPENQVLLGKINMIDLSSGTKYSGGAGLDAFWNIGIAAPISGITPPYLFGTIVNITGKKLKWTFMMYDPLSTVKKSGFEKPFNEGVVFSASPAWKIKIGNSEGNQSLRIVYSTQDGENLYDFKDIHNPVEVTASEKKNRYYASFNFNQTLKKISDNESWGLFGQIGISDGNPNPVDFSFVLGIGGNSFIKNRAQDKWGIALSNYSLSNIIDRRAIELAIPLRNELAVEAFYQYWVNTWFSFGTDVQIINPVLKNSKTATFLGLRTSVEF